MARRLLERRRLPNGLVLEFWDESRRVAGDRWYMGLRAVVPVPLPKAAEDGIPREVLQILRNRVGDRIHFQFKEERNFIPENEVETVREELKRIFLANSLPYLSHPAFPRRFLLQKARDVAQKMQWGEDYLEKLLDELRGPVPPDREEKARRQGACPS